MAAEHTWAECLPLSGQPAQAECSSQVEWGELFTILIGNATFLVSGAKTVNNFVWIFFFFFPQAALSLTFADLPPPLPPRPALNLRLQNKTAICTIRPLLLFSCV